MANQPAYNCRKHIISSWRIHNGKMEHLAFKMPCKSWSCPVCRRNKAHLIGKRASKGMENERVRFATLTLANEFTVHDGLCHIKKSWNRLRLSLTRKYGKIKYLWVMEPHKKSKLPHLHILLNIFIPQKELSAMAVTAGFGKIADIRAVKSKAVLGYVLKYLVKGSNNDEFEFEIKLGKHRRWGSSRGLGSEAIDKNPWIMERWIKSHDLDENTATLEQKKFDEYGITGEIIKTSKNGYQVNYEFGSNNADFIYSLLKKKSDSTIRKEVRKNPLLKPSVYFPAIYPKCAFSPTQQVYPFIFTPSYYDSSIN